MCFSEALEFIVSGTCITQVSQFSLVDSNVLNTVSQTYKVFSTQEMVTEDHCQSTSETALAGTLPGQRLPPRTVLCWSCLAFAYSLLRNYSTGEAQPRGEEHVLLSHPKGTCSAWVRVCLWAPTVLAETPLPRAMEGFGSPALRKHLETAISVCSQTEQRSIMPNGN